jgi:hypothetical protein
MRLYFAGGEVPSHRNLLASVGAPHVALSYMGLRRRVKFAKPWVIAEKFPEDTDLFLDSGAYTVNNGKSEYTQRDLQDIADHYRQFVAENIDRLSMVSEFDALALGRSWIEQDREDFYDDLPADKFMPIWHHEWGLDYLKMLATKYLRVGVHETSLDGRNLVPYLNSLVQETGVLLHGVAMTKVEEMESIKWHSVASTSWVSPQQYGDTIVWTGRELKRYPKKYKDQARKRHRTLFEREGFDSDKIENDDSSELLRLSVWSWQQVVSDIEKHQGRHLQPVREVTNQADEGDSPFAEIGGDDVDNPPAETRNSPPTADVVRRRDVKPLPVLGVHTETETYVDETGEEKERDVTTVNVRSESTRKCTSCFLASKCPAFEPGANCAYNIPIKITTKQQFLDMQNSLIEMQAQRVMFMRFAEEQEGGYSDPNLSSEMDRLQKMLKAKHEMESEGFSMNLQVKANGATGQTGMLARLFGEQASQAAQALPGGPVSADDVIEGVVDAEWTEV